jgi:hypothetical protein
MKSSIDSFVGFILYVTFCIFHSIVVSPTSPQKGDGFPIHRPSVSKVQLHPLHRVPKSSTDSIHRLILVAVAPLQVLKRGIVSPIHVSSLVQPRHPRILAPSHPRFIESKVPQVLPRVIHWLILAIAPLQVLRRGKVSAYPIHAFALDPRHSAEAFHPNRLLLT